MSSFCFSYQSNRFYHNSEVGRFPTLKSRFSSILYIYPYLHPASAFLRLAQDAVIDNLAISSHSQCIALLQLIADIFLQATIDEDLLFPEEFRHWLCADPRIGPLFEEMHADLFRADYWRALQNRIREGHVEDVYAYRRRQRFSVRFV